MHLTEQPTDLLKYVDLIKILPVQIDGNLIKEQIAKNENSDP